jgi:hypothetical protein
MFFWIISLSPIYMICNYEDYTLHSWHCENLKSNISYLLSLSSFSCSCNFTCIWFVSIIILEVYILCWSTKKHYINMCMHSIMHYSPPTKILFYKFMGPTLTTEVCWKPTHTLCTSSPTTLHHVKSGDVDSLISRAKVICQNQKDFNNEIKNMRHDLLLNEYL